MMDQHWLYDLSVTTHLYLKPWFHVKIKLFERILGLHGTTSEMK